MPLQPNIIQKQIDDMIKSSASMKPDEARQALASGLTDIIVNAIKSAQVNPGIPVSTSGGAGATTGPGTLS